MSEGPLASGSRGWECRRRPPPRPHTCPALLGKEHHGDDPCVGIGMGGDRIRMGSRKGRSYVASEKKGGGAGFPSVNASTAGVDFSCREFFFFFSVAPRRDKRSGARSPA